MTRGPLYRTIKRDIPILVVVDEGELKHQAIAKMFNVPKHVVDDAIRRRKTFRTVYVFHAEQLSNSFQPRNVARKQANT